MVYRYIYNYMPGSLLIVMRARNCHDHVMRCLGIEHVSLSGMTCYVCGRSSRYCYCVWLVRCWFCVVLSNTFFGAHVFLQAFPKRVRLARNTEPVQSRKLPKTDHIRTRIIGGPCATHGTHLHVDTGPCAKDAESPCDVNGGESEVLSFVSATMSWRATIWWASTRRRMPSDGGAGGHSSRWEGRCKSTSTREGGRRRRSNWRHGAHT